jgi:hypothetical protein
MEITFDVNNYTGDARELIAVLNSLRKHKCWTPVHDRDIERITCRVPSSALKYAQLVMKNIGISSEAERVFIKNPEIGVRYLVYMGKKEFSDPVTQKKFWKKLCKDPSTAFKWAQNFGRLSETEEEVFLKSMSHMWQYARHVIRGRFPEKIHNMILLKSYEEMYEWEKKSMRDYLSYVGS